MTRELLDETQVGTRRMAGTDFPVIDQLWRDGQRAWSIVRELCNGVPRTRETFRSEAAAREAFESRLEGRKPRAGERANVRIGVRLTEGEHAVAKALADKEGRTVSDLARAAIQLAVARGSTR